MPGHLTVYMGPMFSGKTTRLCQDLNNYADLPGEKFKVLYINSKLDSRSKTEMSTHGSVYLSSKIVKIKLSEVTNKEIKKHTKRSIYDFDVIGIDEASFFSSLDNVIEWVDMLGKIVIVAGLDGSFERKPFGKVVDLCRLADHVEKLSAKCHICLESKVIADAPFTKKFLRSPDSRDDTVIDVGGSEKYIAVCRRHFIE